MAAPDTAIAAARPTAQPNTPNTTMSVAPPARSRRARAASTRAMRSGGPSSSVSQATSAPPENAQPSPQSACVTTTNGNAVTYTGHHHADSQQPVSDHQRPLVAERVGPGAGRDIRQHQRDGHDNAKQDEVSGGQVIAGDEVQAGSQHVAPVEHRPQIRPPQERGPHAGSLGRRRAAGARHYPPVFRG